MTTQNKYILGESSYGNIINQNDKIEINLQLKSSPYDIEGGRIYGEVIDRKGIGIKDAIVKIKSLNKSFSFKVLTNKNGEYSLENIPQNDSYIIFVSAKNMMLFESNQFTMSRLEQINMNFTMQEDDKLLLSIIAGKVIDYYSKIEIYNVNVLLFKLNNGQRILSAVTTTNNFGQFTFRNLEEGQYFLVFKYFGYTTFFSNLSILIPSQIIPLKIQMQQEKNINKDIIAGVIYDSNKNPIKEAKVVLYENVNGSLKYVAATVTNSDGIYSFMNIKPGSYKVISY